MSEETKETVTNEEETTPAEPENNERKERGEGCKTRAEKREEKKEEKKYKEENEALKQSMAELNDRYTRMLAEYDNFRKRAQKEREGIYGDACADVLNQILPIKDSLEMAMKFADDSQLSQGVTMTLNKFNEVLKNLGVEEFGAAGDSFDPQIHNAVFHVEDETLGENVIVEVLMKGYKKNDKIIRYAMVKVAN